MSTKDHYISIAISVSEIANHYFYSGYLEDALTLLKESLNLLRNDDVPQTAIFDIKLVYGSLLAQQAWLVTADYTPATEIAEQLLTSVKSDTQRAKALNLKGNILRQQALGSSEPDYDTPRRLFEESLNLLNPEEEPNAYFWSLFRIALCDQFTQDYDKALTGFKQSESIARQHDFKHELSYATRHIGFVYQATEQYEDALSAFTESLNLRLEVDFKIFLAMSYIAVAGIHEKLGNMDVARDHYRLARDSADAIGYARPRLISYANYGNALYLAGQIDEARARLITAKGLAEDLQHQGALTFVDNLLEQIQADKNS